MDEGPQQIFYLILLQNNPSTLVVLGYCCTMILLLLLSGLVSGSEVAFFSLTSEKIEECAVSDKSKDRLIAKLLRNPKRLLASILIFNNLVNVAMITIATFFTWQLVGKEGFWAWFTPTVIVTTVIVFFGEILPKVYANNKSLVFARLTANMLSTVNRIFYFLAYPLMKFSSIIEKRIESRGYDISVDQLNEAIELATDEQTSEEEKDILRGIINFSSLTVKQIMRSRTDIVCIDITDDFHQLMDKINKSQFSRLPVYEEDVDHIAGVLHVKDLLPFINNNENFNWKILIKSAFFIPESKRVDDLMRNFQEKRVHMAIVIDEYGGTAGLITLEDVIEEIVGEINDEFDAQDIEFSKIDDHTYVFEGKTLLTDITKILDLNHDIFDEVKGENESLGGLLLEINKSMPKVNEEIKYGQFTFKVESVNTKRIKRVRLEIKGEGFFEHMVEESL